MKDNRCCAANSLALFSLGIINFMNERTITNQAVENSLYYYYFIIIFYIFRSFLDHSLSKTHLFRTAYSL